MKNKTLIGAAFFINMNMTKLKMFIGVVAKRMLMTLDAKERSIIQKKKIKNQMIQLYKLDVLVVSKQAIKLVHVILTLISEHPIIIFKKI